MLSPILNDEEEEGEESTGAGMALQDLVGTECGRSHPLTKLTSHFLLDQTHEDHGLIHSDSSAGTDQLVQEYFEEFYGQKTQTFSMDSLFQEITKIESVEFSQIPPADHSCPDDSDMKAVDSSWVQEYLGSRKPFNVDYHDDDIWRLPPYQPNIPEIDSTFNHGFDSIWTPVHFEPDERNIDVDENWLQESEADEGREGSLQELAKLFINSVDDPKLKGSKFMKFMQLVGNGDVSISGGHVTEHLKPELSDGNDANVHQEVNKRVTEGSESSICTSDVAKS